MQSIRSIVGLLIAGALIQGCTLAATEPVSEPVILGALYSLSGGQSGLDVPSSQGAQLAIDEANRDGGVLGRPVQLVLEDVQSQPAVVADRAAKILDNYPSTAALFGLSDTDLVLAAAPVAVEQRRVFLTSGATSPKLPAEAPGVLFLACFGDNVQAAAGAEWAYEDLSARTASVLFNTESTYTQLLQGYFRTRFEELGGKILSVEGYVPGGDISTAASRLQPADLVYLSATPDDALAAALALRGAGHSVPILGGDGLDVAGLWQEHPEVSNLFFTTHGYLGSDNDDPKVVAFLEAYSQSYPGSTPDAFAALGYDAARLLLTAIRNAGSSDPDQVRRALASIREFDGVTGRMGFEAGSQIPLKSVSILGVDGGTVGLVEQVMPVRAATP